MPNKSNRLKNKMVYYEHEHDDRGGPSSSERRRVSFKNYGPRPTYQKNVRIVRKNNRDEKMRIAMGIHEEDVEMMLGSFSHSRGNRYHAYQMRGMSARRGRGNLRRDSPNPGKRLPETPVQWYKVIVLEGQKYEKDYLLGLIQSYIKPLVLTPLGYTKEGGYKPCVSFFVDDYKTAQQIMLADRKITTSDSWKLMILVRALIPQIDVDDHLRALLKLAMSGRYNAENKALDLSKIHVDPVILKENVFCPLNRTSVMITAIQIIADSIPDLVALNLSENKLVTIDGLKMLKTSTPNLKLLYIGKNNIRFIDQFDSMQGLQIEELELDGNPLCDKFKDKDSYIREVQKRFPKVIKLDGTEVPRMITFDVEEEIPLVPSQGSFVCHAAAAVIIRPFLQQYYTVYDSDSRAPLLDAYHEEAQFSLSCSGQSSASGSMAPYIQDNRNLLVVTNPERRKKLLKQGRNNILAYLTNLPKTEHDPASLTVDCPIFTPALIMLSVTGVFKEKKKYPLRSFHRSFVIVPVGEGYCIINELLHITPATSEQVKGAFKSPEAAPVAPAPEVPPVVVAPVVPVVPPVVPGVVDVATKQQMVTTLAMQTGMNLAWSEKCLIENQWDFNQSLYIFTELQKQGKIPPDAFIK